MRRERQKRAEREKRGKEGERVKEGGVVKQLNTDGQLAFWFSLPPDIIY